MSSSLVRVLFTAALPLLLGACPLAVPSEESAGPGVFNNTTDPNNFGASYIGSAACAACHPDYAELTHAHGHGQALKRVEDAAPQYPAAGTRAGVPNPPVGRTWRDVSYVIGGYTHGAFFVDADGYVLTDGTAGTHAQWYLDFLQNGTTASFAAYKPEQTQPRAYAYECFRCHAVGAQPQDAARPQFQDGRPGIQGTWAEPGVTCEACHGPGSNHVKDPRARKIFADPSGRICARCHLDGDDPNVITAAGGFISHSAQFAELRASGGHAQFSCTVCHDPHVSTTYARSQGLRNDCAACHPDHNMAFHDDFTLVRGDYTEKLACASCHMPYAGRSNSAAGPALVGESEARVGDVRTHVFRIDTTGATAAQMFSADGSQVVKDNQGRAAVAPDFVCLRCHNGTGSVFIISAQGAATIGKNMHLKAAAPTGQ
jgi:hypothetical protein